ncbi:MAG: sulfite exporter TauE/SafE family protein [Marmoricola sp.]|nr:sulfite exporter TauE/SafE family protein [Marmoricola sp.]
MLVLALATVVVAVSCTIHGAVGFGMNLMAVPVLAALDPALVPGPAVAAGLVLSVLILVREPATLDPQLGWAVLGLLPGTCAAVALLAVVPSSALALPIGILVVLAVVLSATPVHLSPHRISLGVAGVASGFLATAASIGGPPLALLYSRSEGARLRNNLSAFFVITAVTSLAALVLSGHFGSPEWRASALILPGVVIGFVASGPMRRVLDRGRTRPAVLTLSALAGIVAIIEGLLHLR